MHSYLAPVIGGEACGIASAQAEVDPPAKAVI